MFELDGAGRASDDGLLAGVSARVMGDRAVLVECGGPPSRGGAGGIMASLQLAVADGTLRGVTEIVPAARTLLVCCTSWETTRSVRIWVEAWAARGAGEHAPLRNEATSPVPGRHVATEVVIDVVYDGEDLARAASLLGLSGEALAAAHGNASWQAEFGGFAPGFMYLTAEDWAHRLPRLDAPRERVPAGAVALAGAFSAVYPAASPGGWQLIGQTEAEMWSLDREQAALVRPGDRVRFRAVRELVRVAPQPPAAAALETPTGLTTREDACVTLTVVRPGLFALVQDLGRPGYRVVGVTESGAMDRAALARANAAVGNSAGQAALETVGGGLELRAERATTIAVSGGAAALEIVDAHTSAVRQVAPATAADVLPGDIIRLLRRGRALRHYLAVRGGICGTDSDEPGASRGASRGADGWLGSRATDTLSGIGPRPLAVGERLFVGASAVDEACESRGEGQCEVEVQVEGEGEVDRDEAMPPGVTVLRVLIGPRDDWFDAAARSALVGATWTVTSQADRVGARLSGPVLRRTQAAASAELPSEGMVRGAIQVPPGGEPVLFLADHPVTGGYPVIAAVIDADLDRAGQLAPGDKLRFEVVSPATPEASWPIAVSRGARPEWVNCSLEIDGRRHAIRLPGALAAVLDEALGATGDTDLLESAHEVMAGIVRAIRSVTAPSRTD